MSNIVTKKTRSKPLVDTLPDVVDPATKGVLLLNRSDIKPGVQVRDMTSMDTVERYASIMQDAGAYDPFPPVKVVKYLGDYVLIDGNHRLGAYDDAGLTCPVPAELLPDMCECESDLYLLAVQANSKTGLTLSPYDRKKIARKIIVDRPEMSLRAVAELCGLSKSTVGDIKTYLSKSGQIETPQKTVGKDGVERAVPEKEKWVARCSACGKKITESMWSDVNGYPDIIDDSDLHVVEVGEKPHHVFCNRDCRKEWDNKQAEKEGTQLLKESGYNTNGCPDTATIAAPAAKSTAPATTQKDRQPPAIETTTEDSPTPCPWCGNIPNVCDYYVGKITKYAVYCRGSDCKVNPNTSPCATKADAIAAWNTRKGGV